jgi:hypothetical protein
MWRSWWRRPPGRCFCRCAPSPAGGGGGGGGPGGGAPPPPPPPPAQIFKPATLLSTPTDEARIAYTVTRLHDCATKKPFGLTTGDTHVCVEAQEGSKAAEDVVLSGDTEREADMLRHAIAAARQQAVLLSVPISGVMTKDAWKMGAGLAVVAWPKAAPKPIVFISGVSAYKGGALWYDGFAKDQGGADNPVNGKGSAVVASSNKAREFPGWWWGGGGGASVIPARARRTWEREEC